MRLAKDDLPMLAVAEPEEPPPAAKVISQYPPAGRPIYEGTAVHLVVWRLSKMKTVGCWQKPSGNGILRADSTMARATRCIAVVYRVSLR